MIQYLQLMVSSTLCFLLRMKNWECQVMSSKTNKITGDYEFIISRYVWLNILFFKIIKEKFKNIISVSAQVNFLLIF